MKEINAILSFYDQHKPADQQAAIALVVRVEESSYRREGARMLVLESGFFEGGISGGCLEGDALKRSQIAIMKGQPSMVTYDTSKDDENQIGVGLGCNGIIDVLISPIAGEEDQNLALLRRCTASRQAHIIATVTGISREDQDVRLGHAYYFDCASGTLEGCPHPALAAAVTRDAKQVLDARKSKVARYVLDDFEATVFLEWIPPQLHLAIYGDNYDVYPLLDMAGVLDWDLSLVGKIGKLKKQRLQKVSGLFPGSGADRPAIDNRTAIVLMAHDYKTDLANLQAALRTEAPYIGVLGPKKRFHKMLADLEKAGASPTSQQMERLFAPCGLEIGADTPEEIATSIVAEILSVFGNKKGGSLREKSGPIHERV